MNKKDPSINPRHTCAVYEVVRRFHNAELCIYAMIALYYKDSCGVICVFQLFNLCTVMIGGFSRREISCWNSPVKATGKVTVTILNLVTPCNNERRKRFTFNKLL